MRNYYNPYYSNQAGYNNTPTPNNANYGSGYNAYSAYGQQQVQQAANNMAQYNPNQVASNYSNQAGYSNTPNNANYGSGYNAYSAYGQQQVQQATNNMAQYNPNQVASNYSNQAGYNQQQNNQQGSYNQQLAGNNMNYYNRESNNFRY